MVSPGTTAVSWPYRAASSGACRRTSAPGSCSRTALRRQVETHLAPSRRTARATPSRDWFTPHSHRCPSAHFQRHHTNNPPILAPGVTTEAHRTDGNWPNLTEISHLPRSQRLWAPGHRSDVSTQCYHAPLQHSGPCDYGQHEGVAKQQAYAYGHGVGLTIGRVAASGAHRLPAARPCGDHNEQVRHGAPNCKAVLPADRAALDITSSCCMPRPSSFSFRQKRLIFGRSYLTKMSQPPTTAQLLPLVAEGRCTDHVTAPPFNPSAEDCQCQQIPPPHSSPSSSPASCPLTTAQGVRQSRPTRNG